MSDAALGDLQGPAGNTYDKYETRNPVARRLVERFLHELDAQVRDCHHRQLGHLTPEEKQAALDDAITTPIA